MPSFLRSEVNHLFLLAAATAAGCSGSDLLGVEPPKQRGSVNPMAERGRDSYEQRQRDCYEMPNAAACYEVGMNYEMGLATEIDIPRAIEFYDKACSLESQKEHCDAAERLRKQP